MFNDSLMFFTYVSKNEVMAYIYIYITQRQKLAFLFNFEGIRNGSSIAELNCELYK